MTSTNWRDGANRVRRHPGTPLPPSQKDFFEQGFGCSLEPIRLHVDRDGAEALGAEAFAVGRHIVLRQAPPDWNAPSARYLLGHEIAHSLQQRTVGDAAPVVAVGGANDPLEREAHGAAADLLAGRRVGRLSRESHAVVRRVVSIVRESAGIALGQGLEMRTPEPHIQKETGAKVVTFSCGQFEGRGVVTLLGNPGDDVSGFTLGFIQCLRESNWAIYRGRSNDHGSMLFQRAGQPRQRWHLCRDTLKGGRILVDTSGSSSTVPSGSVFGQHTGSHVPLWCRLVDDPQDWYELELTNPHTKQTNFIWEANTRLEFCTVLTLRDPAGRFTHLKHVSWTVHWHFRFEPPNAKGAIAVTEQEDAVAAPGAVQDGAPTTLPHFARILTEATTPQCLALSDRGFQKPDVQASRRWENFDVTR